MVGIFYKSIKVGLATQMEGISVFCGMPITKGKQAVYSLDCILNNNVDNIPLVVTDEAGKKQYLNQLVKGEMFVWNLSDVNLDSSSRDMNYDVYNKPQLSQNDVLATSPPRDIINNKVESESNTTITYKLKYNTNKDYSHVPLNWNNNKKKSLQSYFFCDEDGKKICQFYKTDKDGKGTICNAYIV